MVASAKGRLVSVLAVAAALAAVLLYRAPFSKVPGIMFPLDSDFCFSFHVSLLCSISYRICGGGGMIAELLLLQSLGGEGCSLLPHDHFWVASDRVVTLGRVGPAAGTYVRPPFHSMPSDNLAIAVRRCLPLGAAVASGSILG